MENLNQYLDAFNTFLSGPFGVALIAGITSWLVSRKHTERTKALLSLREVLQEVNKPEYQTDSSRKDPKLNKLTQAINELAYLEVMREIEKYIVPKRGVMNQILEKILIILLSAFMLLTVFLLLASLGNSVPWRATIISAGLTFLWLIALIWAVQASAPHEKTITAKRAQLYNDPEIAVSDILQTISKPKE